MKLSGNYNVGGEVAKEDERYKVVDNTALKGLVLSSTDLNPGHSTSGHKHAGQYLLEWAVSIHGLPC